MSTIHISTTGLTTSRNIALSTIQDIKKKFKFIDEFYNYINDSRTDNDKKKAIIYALNKSDVVYYNPSKMNNASLIYLDTLLPYIKLLYPNADVKYYSNFVSNGGIYYSDQRLADNKKLFISLNRYNSSTTPKNLKDASDSLNKMIVYGDFIGGTIFSQKYHYIHKNYPFIIEKLHQEKAGGKISNSSSLFHKLSLTGKDFNKMIIRNNNGSANASLRMNNGSVNASLRMNNGSATASLRRNNNNRLQASILFAGTSLDDLENKSIEEIIERINQISRNYGFNSSIFASQLSSKEKNIIRRKIEQKINNISIISTNNAVNNNNNNWEALAENKPQNEIKKLTNIMNRLNLVLHKRSVNNNE